MDYLLQTHLCLQSSSSSRSRSSGKSAAFLQGGPVAAGLLVGQKRLCAMMLLAKVRSQHAGHATTPERAGRRRNGGAGLGSGIKALDKDQEQRGSSRDAR